MPFLTRFTPKEGESVPYYDHTHLSICSGIILLGITALPRREHLLRLFCHVAWTGK